MQKKTQNNFQLEESLLTEIEDTVKLIRDIAASNSSNMALVKLIPEIQPCQWEALSTRLDLKDWLTIPLSGTQTSALEALFESVYKLAFQRDHDILTGLANKFFFDSYLQKEFDRAIRSKDNLTLIFIDLDNFTKINDEYGYSTGDLVLKKLGEMLKKSMRTYDTVARTGGGEFSIILPSISSVAALLIVNKILSAFCETEFIFNNKKVNLTFSAGVSTLKFLPQPPSVSALSESAKKALLQAKQAGKNRVIVAGSPQQQIDRSSLVHAAEKRFLFSGKLSEEGV